MRHPRLSRPALLASALALTLALPAGAGAGDPGKDPRAIRDHIAQDVASALAKQPGAAPRLPQPTVVPSRPAALAHAANARTATTTTAATSPHASTAPGDTSADGVWAEMLAGNQRFVTDRPLAHALGRERSELVGEQHPHAIVLGCSDSRVGPEIVFDQTLGELFVVRTAGNIVDPIALGSLEYAVEHLHPKLLVVLGHGGCGAVKAAISGEDMPSTHLQAIVDRIRPTVQRLTNCFEGDELVQRSVIANARQSAVDILANSELLRAAVAKGELRVVSAVYDLQTGQVTAVTTPAATAQARAPAH